MLKLRQETYITTHRSYNLLSLYDQKLTLNVFYSHNLVTEEEQQSSLFKTSCQVKLWGLHILIYIQQDAMLHRLFIYFWKLLYIFRVVYPPIITTLPRC